MNVSDILTGINEIGEAVLVGEDEHVRITKTLQDNGWTRVIIEYEDGCVEEMYTE